jgi:hypothetical protein
MSMCEFKNKKFHHKNVVMMHLLKKGFIEKYLYWFAHGESYVPYKTILEMIIGLISSSSNIHGFMDDNSNPYKIIMINITGMTRGYLGEGSCNILLDKDSL